MSLEFLVVFIKTVHNGDWYILGAMTSYMNKLDDPIHGCSSGSDTFDESFSVFVALLTLTVEGQN